PKVLSHLPPHPDRSSRHLSGLTPSGQRTSYLEAAENHDEVGTAFSFEVGDQLKELGISVRRPERSPSPEADSEPQQEEDEIDSDEEIGSAFSFEEGDGAKELGVSSRDPVAQQPDDFVEPHPPQQSTRHTGTEEQADGPAFKFEEDGELKEMGLSDPPPPPKRRNSPLAQLEIPRMTKDRSRSFEDRNQGQSQNQAGQGLTPEDIEHRLRSRSFEPAAQGRWELQVSVLDQTGARTQSRESESRESTDSDYYSSASEPGSSEDEDTFDAEVPVAAERRVRPSVMPVAARDAQRPTGARSSPSVVHHRTHQRMPSTPLTSPDSDTSGLCRANFASPIKEQQLAEELSSPRSPPAHAPQPQPQPQHQPQPYRPFYAPSTAPAPVQTPSPREVGWSVASPAGWGGSFSAGAEDTMKETWGSGPRAAGADGEKSKVSFRLSGPPDFMPAFF
ncbi:hypothetical protein IMZ48_16915, partial [Candidatus Bathyarchaeota archaeon]|nr:hypothetical protein [Candidatus Bathyarchaeota archaeon]